MGWPGFSTATISWARTGQWATGVEVQHPSDLVFHQIPTFSTLVTLIVILDLLDFVPTNSGFDVY